MDVGDFMDLRRLEELEALLGPDEFRGCLRDFLEEAAEAVTAACAAQDQPPGPERAATFHFLAGAAKNVGAARFGALCTRFERSRERLTAADYQDFCAEFQLVWRVLDGLCNDRPIALAG